MDGVVETIQPPEPEVIGRGMANLAQILNRASGAPLVEGPLPPDLGEPISYNSDAAPPASVVFHNRNYETGGVSFASGYRGLNEETQISVDGKPAVRRSARASRPVSEDVLKRVDEARAKYQPYALNPNAEPTPDSGVTRGGNDIIEYTRDGVKIRYEPVGERLAESDGDVFWGGRNWKESITVGEDTFAVEGRTLLAFERLAQANLG